MTAVALVVIAKAPAPGRSKTRLCPPCTPRQAADLAEAALCDTLAAAALCPARRRLLALEGEPGAWLPADFELLEQAGDGLGERLGHALVAAGGPALVVGMDTPQLTAGLLAQACTALSADGADAVLGPALDGGYWTIGLQQPDPAVFAGVPMSVPSTFAPSAAGSRSSACAGRDWRPCATWTPSPTHRRSRARLREAASPGRSAPCQ